MSSFINFNNRESGLESKYSAEVIKAALLKSETKSSIKAETLTKNIKEPVSLNEALVFFTDKLGAIKQLSQSIVEINEGRVKQFEMDYTSMVKDIKKGYGWIDPDYVAQTWDNSSDSIDFELVRDEIFDRLIAAGLLAHADDNDPEKAGKKIKSAKDLYVMESEEEVEEISETRYYAFHKGQKHEIEADSLWGAKQKAITDLKVKKKDVGMLAIVLADSHDDFSKGKNSEFAFEGETTVYESATAQLADEEKFELYTATLKNKTATLKATTTTKTWDDGVPVLKYLARGSAKPTPIQINGSFEVAHDVAHGWFYFTDGRKWFGLHIKDGYGDPTDLPFNMEVKESVVNESEAENILQDLLDERGGDMGELHGMEMEDALDTVEAYGHKGSKAKKIAKELVSMCNESVVTEAKFVKDFNKDVLKAKTKEEVLELYPNAEFFIGKSDHFFGELDDNLFFKAYYTKAQKEFEIKSVYSEKGSNYVHLYNESVVNEAKFVKEFDKAVLDAETEKDVLKVYPKAKFFVGKHSHFFGELDDNLFFRAYYAKYYKEDTGKSIKGDFKITSVYSEKGSNYVHLHNESVVTEGKGFKNTTDFEKFLIEIDGMGEAQIKKIMGKDYIDTPGFYQDEKDDYEDIIDFMTSNMGNSEFEKLESWWENNVAESVVNEAKFDKKSLMKAMKKDDGFIQLGNGQEYIIYAYDNGNDDNDAMWGDKTIFALDQDGEEHEIKYSDIVSYNESAITEGRSVNKIQKEWNQVTTDMIQKVQAWKDAEGDRKVEILEELKALTARKKALESELDVAVAGKDKDVQLVVSEGNAFGAARAKAIANGEKTFKVEGEEYDVEGVDKEDKENAEEFVSERNAFLAARAKAIQEESDEFEFNGKTYPVIYEGNAFGAARAEAIANGASTFTVDGEEYDVEDVDAEDKKNAEEFVEESEILWDALIEKFAITNEDLRSDIKKYIKTNKKEIDALADQDDWDRIYSMLMTDFQVEEDDDKATDELKTIFNIVY